MFSMIEATPEHWEDVANNMRQEVIDEIYASHGFSPEQMQDHLSTHSSDVMALVWDGDVMGITGIHQYTLLSDMASPWFLTTNEAPKHGKDLLRSTKKMLSKWTKEYRILINYIDVRFTESLRWARWAGFKVYPPERYGLNGELFSRIEIRSEEWVG